MGPIDLVNFVIIFLSQVTLIFLSNFPAWIPDCDSQNPALLDLFFSSDASICSTLAFSPLENYHYVIVSVSIDFPSNTKQDAPFHCIVYDYSHAD